jgi:HlyD family secretion protein
LGVEEQRVNVIVDPDRVPESIGDGFRVEASIVVWSTPSATSVPRSALVQSTPAAAGTGTWSAFVVRDDRLEVRSVRLGHLGGAQAEVVAGLKAGDTVVVFPSDQVKAGARVRLRKS